MTIKLIAGAFGLALLASPAVAAGSLPFAQHSEPTVWGHEVRPSETVPQIDTVELRRPIASEAEPGLVPSEPTVWGHHPDGGR